MLGFTVSGATVIMKDRRAFVIAGFRIGNDLVRQEGHMRIALARCQLIYPRLDDDLVQYILPPGFSGYGVGYTLNQAKVI